MASSYCPSRGDIVWLNFSPQAGHEQAGHRPALVLSPESYNKKTGLALMCPITSHVKGYPFEVLLPAGSHVSGVILSDQVRNLDWKERKAQFKSKVPSPIIREVLNKLGVLIDM
ncbi:MAG: endoribonuclease MazF [Fibrobacteres bacterium]|nr:endoribonuclease MazF [Fibrobacterota bacterium]